MPLRSAELCRKMGVGVQTFFTWKTKYAGMDIVEMRRIMSKVS